MPYVKSADFANLGTVAHSEDIIITSAFITLGSSIARDTMPHQYGGSGKGFDFKTIIGGMAAFTMLLVLGQFAPNLASAFAVMSAVISFLYNGAPLLQNFVFAK